MSVRGRGGSDVDVAAREGVADGVLDQAVDQRRVAGGGCGLERGAELDSTFPGLRPGTPQRGVGEDREVDWFAVVEPALAGGERQ